MGQERAKDEGGADPGPDKTCSRGSLVSPDSATTLPRGLRQTGSPLWASESSSAEWVYRTSLAGLS